MEKDIKKKILQFKDIWEHGRCFCPNPKIDNNSCKYCGGYIKNDKPSRMDTTENKGT